MAKARTQLPAYRERPAQPPRGTRGTQVDVTDVLLKTSDRTGIDQAGILVTNSDKQYGGLILYNATDTYNSEDGTGTYQILLSQYDGRLYAGGGGIALDNAGATIVPSLGGTGKYNFATGYGNPADLRGGMYGILGGTVEIGVTAQANDAISEAIAVLSASDGTADNALRIYRNSGNDGAEFDTHLFFDADSTRDLGQTEAGTKRRPRDVYIGRDLYLDKDAAVQTIRAGTTHGLNIGANGSQLIGLWGAAPIARPTTGIASATRVGGGGTTITTTDTFDGYKIDQVVKALRNSGILT